MSAVARVWWTFFTAIPLQRWLAWSGLVLVGLLTITGLVLHEALFGVVFSSLAFFILVMFPTLFASAAVFRALSASRANRFLPQFRSRMLAAVLALQVTGLVLFALLLSALAWFGGRPMPFVPLLYAFEVGTAIFMLMFLVFGDWRFIWVWIGTFVAISVVGRAAPQALAAIPASAWLVAALAAWVAFGGWYLRARFIKPLLLVPQPPSGKWFETRLRETLTREQALRVLTNPQLPWSRPRLFAGIVSIIVLVTIITFFASPTAGFFPFTSFIWPFGMMVLLWGKTMAIVHRSRLLWLRMPGTRDVVRREVERAVLRNLAGAGLLLLGAAVLYSSPLLAVPLREVLAALALSLCAGLFGTYAALAAIPGNLPQLAAFAVLMVAQFGLLSQPSPALPDVVIVTALELVAALTFRALAVIRWRRIDWLQVRPLPPSNMLRGGG
jgi:hypothetical protein